jgi:hypothetical protein
LFNSQQKHHNKGWKSKTIFGYNNKETEIDIWENGVPGITSTHASDSELRVKIKMPASYIKGRHLPFRRTFSKSVTAHSRTDCRNVVIPLTIQIFTKAW